VRTIQEAPPTLVRGSAPPLGSGQAAGSSSTGPVAHPTLQSGLEQLARFKSGLKALQRC
jgi:hypothetical protein